MTFWANKRSVLQETFQSVLDPLPVQQGTGPNETGVFRGDHDLNPASSPARGVIYKPAAVLVPIVYRDHGVSVILTRRATHLNKHAGQISFPGGRAEASDLTPVETALRESHEEIGLQPRNVEVVGRLNTYLTVTNYSVTPVVGFVDPGNDLIAEEGEVAEIFEVPLEFLMDAQNHRKHSGFHNGVERFWYAMPYKDYYIWGATAGMLKDLSERVPAK